MDMIRTQRHVTYSGAVEALQAGLAKASELGVNVAIAVTDASGELVALGRIEGANPRAWKGALGKATVAAGLGRSTKEFLEKRLKQDEVLWRAMSANPDTFLVPGGHPLLVEGRSVGAVGVSGGHYEDDDRVAQAAADRFGELAEPGSGA
jgi:uncharacterized protein GlcG (DUF336 family)